MLALVVESRRAPDAPYFGPFCRLVRVRAYCPQRKEHFEAAGAEELVAWAGADRAVLTPLPREAAHLLGHPEGWTWHCSTRLIHAHLPQLLRDFPRKALTHEVAFDVVFGDDSVAEAARIWHLLADAPRPPAALAQNAALLPLLGGRTGPVVAALNRRLPPRDRTNKNMATFAHLRLAFDNKGRFAPGACEALLRVKGVHADEVLLECLANAAGTTPGRVLASGRFPFERGTVAGMRPFEVADPARLLADMHVGTASEALASLNAAESRRDWIQQFRDSAGGGLTEEDVLRVERKMEYERM